MNVPFLALIGAVFALSSAIYFTFNLEKRKIVLERLQLARRKTNGALTPSRSISTGQDAKARQPGNDELFPPHRREALSELSQDAMKGPGRSAKELSQVPPDYNKLTPDKAVCNTDDFLDHTTATGFTVEEIQRLGHFPDYAKLSGIPLPNEYKEFDIKKAMPRPYRPYRWPYFQTMCMSTVPFDRIIIF